MNRNPALLLSLCASCLVACTGSSGTVGGGAGQPVQDPDHTVIAAAANDAPASAATPVDSWSALMPEDRSFQRPPPQIGLNRSSSMQGVGGLIDDTGSGTLPTQTIDHSSPERAKQYGSSEVVAGVDGRSVDLDGYLVPLGTNDAGLVDEALFVPFYGACIHVPPPPPNQIIHVTLQAPIALGNLWDPYRLHGTLQIKQFDTDIASAAYDVAGARLEPISG